MAPATATAMLKVRLLALVGPASVTRLVVKETGSAPASAIGLQLWRDSANITPVGASVDATTKTWTFPLALNIATNQYVDLEVYETCASAALGKTARVSLVDAAAVTSSTTVTGTFPYVSGLATVVGSTYLSVTATDLAKTTLYAGTFQSLLKARLAAVGGNITVTGLKIKDIGTITAANLAVQVLKGGVVVDSTVSLDSVNKVWTLTFKTPLTIARDGYLYLEIQAKPTAAAAGSTCGLELTDQTSVRTSAVVAGAFPLRSSVAKVDASPLLVAGGYSVAPATMSVLTWTPMVKVRLEAFNGAVTITGLKVKETGTVGAGAASIELLRSNVLLAHTITGWDATNKIWTLTLAKPLVLAAGTYNYLELREHVTTDALGKTAQLSVVDASYITTTAPVLGTFPVASKAIVVTPNAPIVSPTANPTMVAVGQTVQFDGTARPDNGATIVSYAWDLLGGGAFGTPGASARTSYVYNTAGTYTAVLRATDSRSVSGVGTVGVTVTAGKPPTVTATARPSVTSPGVEVVFDGTAASVDTGIALARYEWDFDGDGTFDTSSPTSAGGKFRYSAPGEYNATLKVTDARGISGSATIKVLVTGVSTFDVSGTNAAPTNAMFFDVTPLLNLRVRSTDWSGLVYALTLNNLGTVDGANVTFQLTQGGTLLPSATRYDAVKRQWGVALATPLAIAGGASADLVLAMTCTQAAATKTVQVSLADRAAVQTNTFITGTFPITSGAVAITSPTPPSVTATANPRTAFIGDNIVFNGSATAGDVGATIVGYDWDFNGDGAWDLVGTTNPRQVRSLSVAGTFLAALRAVDNRGVTATATVSITVKAPTAPIIGSATATPNAALTGATITFGGSATVGDPGFTIARYEWDFEGDGAYDYANNASAATTHVYTREGTFNATLRVTDSRGLSATRSVTVTISPLQPPVVVATASVTSEWRAKALTLDATVTIVDAGSTITRYEWDFEGDGTYDVSSTTTAAVSHAYSTKGNYNATIRVTDSRGLTATSSVVIDIVASGLGDTPWPKFRKDDLSSGRGINQGANGVELWSYKLGGRSLSTPCIGLDNTIFVGAEDSFVYAIRPDGSLRWTFNAGRMIRSSGAVGVDGTLYIGTHDGNMYALDATTGTEKASFSPGAPMRSSPAIGPDGVVYIGCHDSHIYGLDGVTMARRWSYKTGAWVRSSPAIVPDGTAYCGSGDGKVYAFVGKTGVKKWEFTAGDQVYSSPALGSNGVLYFGSLDGKVYAVDAKSGQQRWQYTTGGQVWCSPALGSDNTVYIGSEDRKVYAFDGETGAVKWSYTTGGIIHGSAAIATDGTVYVGSTDRVLYAFDGQTGAVQWSFTAGDQFDFSSPIVGGDGTVFIVSEDGTLHALGHGNPPTLTASASPTTAAVNGTVNFDATATVIDAGSSIVRYEWDFETDGRYDYTSTTTAQTTHAYPALGTYTATLRVTDNRGLQATATVQVTVVASGLANTPWPKWHGNELNVGQGQGQGATGAKRWEFTTSDGIWASACLGADGTVYLGSHNGRMYALDPATGTQKWELAAGSWVKSSAALALDGTLYFGADNRLLAVNSTTGVQKWAFNCNGLVYSSPNVGADGTIYIGSYDNNLYAVNPNGTEKWRYPMGGAVHSSPAIGSGGVVVVGSQSGLVAAINGQTGAKIWERQLGGGTMSSPAIAANGTVFIGAGDNRLYALHGNNGGIRWTVTTGGAVRSSPAICGTDGTVYVGSDDRRLYAIDPGTGAVKWTYETQNMIYASPAIAADGTVYVGSDDFNIYAFDPAGQRKWTFATGDKLIGSPVVAADGTVFCGSADRKIYAIGTAAVQNPPTVTANANPTTVQTGQSVTFGGSATPVDAGTTIAQFAWDFDGDGTTDLTGATATANHTYNTPGTYTAKLEAVDDRGIKGSATVTITVTQGGGGGGGLATGGWPKFRADAKNSGVGRGQGALGNVKWSVTTGGGISASPAIGADGTVFQGSYDGLVYALDGSTGATKWTFTTGGQVHTPATLGANGTLYIGSNDGKLYALAPDTGAKQWEFSTGSQVTGAAAVASDGTVYIGSQTGSFYALDPATGQQKWVAALGAAIWSSAAVGDDGTVYIGCNDSKLHALNPADGSVKWAFTAGAEIVSSPAIGPDGTIYVGSSDSKLYALDPATGQEKWSLTTGGAIQSSPAIANGTVYVGSWDNRLYAVDAATGQQKWSYRTADIVQSSPAIGGDGTIYIGSHDGKLYALDPGTGGVLWQYSAGDKVWAAPAIDDQGNIVCASFNGKVFSIE
jgi:outer membrane protein assembly factor BamB